MSPIYSLKNIPRKEFHLDLYISSISGVPNALVRWKEESSVLDGDSVHDCVTAIKPAILEVQGRAGQGGQGRTGSLAFWKWGSPPPMILFMPLHFNSFFSRGYRMEWEGKEKETKARKNYERSELIGLRCYIHRDITKIIGFCRVDGTRA